MTAKNLIDARGMRCPWPVLRVARALREAPEEVVIIVADDPIAEAELAAFAAERGLELATVQTPHGTGFQLSPKR